MVFLLFVFSVCLVVNEDVYNILSAYLKCILQYCLLEWRCCTPYLQKSPTVEYLSPLATMSLILFLILFFSDMVSIEVELRLSTSTFLPPAFPGYPPSRPPHDPPLSCLQPLFLWLSFHACMCMYENEHAQRYQYNLLSFRAGHSPLDK